MVKAMNTLEYFDVYMYILYLNVYVIPLLVYR